MNPSREWPTHQASPRVPSDSASKREAEAAAFGRRTFIKLASIGGTAAVLSPTGFGNATTRGPGLVTSLLAGGTASSIDAFVTGASKKYSGTTLNLLAFTNVQVSALQALTPDFTRLTGIKVNYTILTETDAASKAQITLSAHSPAFDIYDAENFFIPGYVRNGWFYEVRELAAERHVTWPDFSLHPYSPTALSLLSYTNKLVALPIFFANQVVYYRRDIFERHAVKIPATIAELIDVCKEINNKPLPAIALRANSGPVQNVFVWTTWLYDYGGTYFRTYNKATGKYSGPALDSPQAVTAAELYSDVLRHYAPAGATAWGVNRVSRAMLAGEIAMSQEGEPFGSVWNDPKISRVAGKLGAFPMPRGPGGRYITTAAHGYAISRYSKSVEAAWLYVQWATSPEIQLKAAIEQPSSSPPIPAIIRNPQFRKKYNFPGFLDSVEESLSFGASPVGPTYTPQLWNWDAVGEGISVQLSRIISGEVSAEKGLAEANSILSKQAES